MRLATAIASATAIAVLFVPQMASAQGTSSQVALRSYQPSPFADRGLSLDRSGVLPRGELRLGADLDYGFKPLVLVDKAPGIFQAGSAGPEHDLIAHAVNATLSASFGLGRRMELALALPVTLYQAGESAPGVKSPSMLGIGNARAGIKARLFSRGGFGTGVALLVSAPRGWGALTSESGFGVEGRGFGDYTLGRFSFGARAGVRLKSQVAFHDLSLGNELGFAVGAGLQLTPKTSILAEAAGTTSLAGPFGNLRQSPVEALGGIRRRIGKMWFTLGGGLGLTEGYGAPTFRVVAAVSWANRPPDVDLDGIPDDDDRCPSIPEDRDGFEDNDGCPEPDNDKDGFADAADKCPNQPEDKDGFEDGDGCPEPDNDKDGIADAADKCPDKPETVNQFEDDDGCPDKAPVATPTDTDKDGIVDDKDECPEEAEDKDGFEDEDGCPEPDNDKDGILDGSDKCPLEPETINGVEDQDGCPDTGKPDVRLGANEIETLKPIFFATDRARVRHAFYTILEQVALLMKAHPEIGRVGVEGHTDATGPATWNQRLSIRRANAVVEFLANQGIERGRLVAVGQAEKLPWASNETPWGRAKNRRVVFHIEGVNAAEEKKQEQRKERRRQIQRNSSHDEAAAPASDAKRKPHSNHPPQTDEAGRKPSPAVKTATKPATDDDKAAVGEKTHDGNTHDRAGAKPSSRRLPVEEGAPRPAGAASVKAESVAPHEREEEHADGQPPESETDAGAVPPGTAKKKRPARPPRPIPRPIFTGPAPTLRELLVLPPR